MSLLILEQEKDLSESLRRQILSLNIFTAIYQASTIKEAELIAASKNISLFVVDLDLPDGSGHEFVDHIRLMERYELTWVILLANQEETTQEIIDAYNSNHCHRYVRKPFQTAYLAQMIEELSGKKIVLSSEENRLRIRRKSVDYFFDHDDIVFVETVEKTAYIYTVDKKHKIGRVTLSDLESRLDDKKFIRVHRSYIINTDYIDYINKKNNQNQIKIKYYDTFIPIGRTYKAILGLV